MESLLKFALWSLCSALVLVHSAAGQDVWKRVQNGNVACSPFVAGYDNEQPVWVARAYFENGLLPGKYVYRLGQAYVPFADKEYKVNDFELLCDSRSYKWVQFSPLVHRPGLLQTLDLFGRRPPKDVPSNAVLGGYSAKDKDPLYICRKGGSADARIGKVHIRHSACFYTYGGKEYHSPYMDLLVRD